MFPNLARRRREAETETAPATADVPLAPDYSREEVRLALGDLPDIVVNQHGQATQISYAPLIAVAQLYGHSLIIKQKTEVGQVIIACGPISYPARP